MKGDLFFASAHDSEGNPTEWLDAYDEWGVSLEDGALDVLMAFRPNKEPVVNKNVTADGAHYVTGSGHVDERMVSVPMHIVAIDKADFLIRRAAFYAVIKSGLLTIKILNPVEVIYEMYYVTCTQYRQYIDGMALFTLTLYEANGDNGKDYAKVEPLPMHKDMEQYLLDLLKTYGGLATEEQVRNIVRTYRPMNTNGNFA